MTEAQEFNRALLPAYKRLAAAVIVDALKDVVRGRGGREFLGSDTIWHQLINLDPEKVSKIIQEPFDDDALRLKIRQLENIYGPNRKGSPGNTGSLIPFGKEGNVHHGATKIRPSMSKCK